MSRVYGEQTFCPHLPLLPLTLKGMWWQWERETGVSRGDVMGWLEDQWGKKSVQQGGEGRLGAQWLYPTQAKRLITPLTAS